MLFAKGGKPYPSAQNSRMRKKRRLKLMKQLIHMDAYARILSLRQRLAWAWEQENAPLVRRLSEEIDAIQLLHWEQGVTANAS